MNINLFYITTALLGKSTTVAVQVTYIYIFNYVYIYCIMDVLDFITALGAYLCFTVQPYLWIVHPWNMLSTYSVTSTEHNYVVYTNISFLLQDIYCEKSPFQSVFCVLDIQTPPMKRGIGLHRDNHRTP
jgi:hypothetical protein